MFPLGQSGTVARRTLAALGMTAVVGLVIAACGGPTEFTGSGRAPETGVMTSATTAPHQDGTPGMDDMPTGDGLAAEASGFRFVAVTPSLTAGQPTNFQFRITGADGKPVTAFDPEQTKLMHFYL